jgi:sugar phosphate isomerase/epimerase
VKTCLNPATLRQGIPLNDFLEAASAAGFEAVELRGPWVTAAVNERGLPAVAGHLRAAGLTVAGVGYGVPLHATEAEFDQALQVTPDLCEVIKGLGASGGAVVLPLRQGVGFTVTRDATIDRLGRLGRLTASFDLSIYIEFLGLHVADDFEWTKSLGETLMIMREIGLPNVGLLIDSYHWHLGGSREADLARIPPGTPMLLHINDAPPGDVRSLTDAMRLLPGAGVLDLSAWLRAIQTTTGYDGPVSIELFNDDLRAMDPSAAAKLAHASLTSVLARV